MAAVSCFFPYTKLPPPLLTAHVCRGRKTFGKNAHWMGEEGRGERGRGEGVGAMGGRGTEGNLFISSIFVAIRVRKLGVQNRGNGTNFSTPQIVDFQDEVLSFSCQIV